MVGILPIYGDEWGMVYYCYTIPTLENFAAAASALDFCVRCINQCFSGLGINHEQKRADGSREYYGKGPHLEMFWENTGQWGSQYTPDTWTYIGSADDGAGDPQIGYAPYDFASWHRLKRICASL